ncbi:TPA: hypothetical protein VCM61_000398 [Campylobacter upsaliensis]|nr:hypothetical protein [Campylobacter upsaliensis]
MDKDYLEELEEHKIKKSAYTNVNLPSKHYFVFGKIFHFNSAKRLSAKNQKAKQVLVKLISNMGVKRLENSLNYMIKNSDNAFALNEKGEECGVKELMKDWSKTFSNRANAKEAWHLVFSLDEEYLSEKKQRAFINSVKDVMSSHFLGHKYAFVMHNHQAKPHIHIVVNKYNVLENKKIHFAKKSDIKYFFEALREDFAYALGARGLDYINRSPLEKNLQEATKKMKQMDRVLESDSQFGISQIFQNIQLSLHQKIMDKEKRIVALKLDYDTHKNERERLQALLEQYIIHNNKRRFALMKQMKIMRKEFKEKSALLLSEMKELRRLNNALEHSKKDLKTHTLSRIQSASYKRNFLKSYEKIYPNHKGASKKDIQNYYRVKNSLEQESKEYKKELFLYSTNYYFKHSFENANLFDLEKKTRRLNENIDILKSMDYFVKQESESYLNNLEKNLSYINHIYKKRFENLEKELLEKGNKNPFLMKEYTKGCEFLGVENQLKKAMINEAPKNTGARNLYEEIQKRYNKPVKNETKENSINSMERSF